MRSTRVRRTMVKAAVATSLVLAAAACAKPSTGTANTSPGGSGSLGGLTLTEGAVLVSDGTNVVTIGDQKVTFPTTVTDAAWSPDGSRVAFIDKDGNLATAHPDGSAVLVLTRTDPSVTRSRPAWSRTVLFYAEKKGDGTSALKTVPANGCTITGQPSTGADWPMDTGDGTSYVDLAPSAAQTVRPSTVIFQHDEPSGPQIWANDTNQRDPYTHKLEDGSEPALRADGTKFAYVGTNGQVFVRDRTGNAVSVQITFGADHPTRLTWMPDGQHVAYKTPGGAESVSTSPGNNSNPATKLSTTSGVPTFLPSTKDSVSRVTGADPIAVAIAASQARWPTVAQFESHPFYAGASAAVIAIPGQVGLPNTAGPLLLTDGDTLDPRTKAELQRLFGTILDFSGTYYGPDIYVYGSAISANIVTALEGMHYKVHRLNQASSPAPSAAAAQCGWAGAGDVLSRTLVVVDPSSAANDAIATSLAVGAPVLRIDPKAGLTDQVRSYLSNNSSSLNQIFIVDPANAISPDLEKEIGTLLSGPLGYTAGTNPTVPPLTN